MPQDVIMRLLGTERERDADRWSARWILGSSMPVLGVFALLALLGVESEEIVAVSVAARMLIPTVGEAAQSRRRAGVH